MLAERIEGLLALTQLQRVLSETSTTNIVAAVLIGAAAVLLADYAWMLYLSFKMVSWNPPWRSNFLTSI